MVYFAGSLLSVMMLFSPQDAVLNERPPVERQEMETLWKIDCRESVRILADTIRLADSEMHAMPGRLALLERDLLLCAHIDEALADFTVPHELMARALREWRACAARQQAECEHEKQHLRDLTMRLDANQGEASPADIK